MTLIEAASIATAGGAPEAPEARRVLVPADSPPEAHRVLEVRAEAPARSPGSPGASWTSPWFKRSGSSRSPSSPWWNRSGKGAKGRNPAPQARALTGTLDAAHEPQRTVSAPLPSSGSALVGSEPRRRRRARRKSRARGGGALRADALADGARELGALARPDSARSTSTVELKAAARRYVQAAKERAEERASLRRDGKRQDAHKVAALAEEHRSWLRAERQRALAEGRVVTLSRHATEEEQRRVDNLLLLQQANWAPLGRRVAEEPAFATGSGGAADEAAGGGALGRVGRDRPQAPGASIEDIFHPPTGVASVLSGVGAPSRRGKVDEKVRRARRSSIPR